MELFSRERRVRQRRMEDEIVELFNRQFKQIRESFLHTAESNMAAHPSMKSAVKSEEPDSILMLSWHTLNAFLYQEIEERYGYRAAGQIGTMPFRSIASTIGKGKGGEFTQATADYYNTRLNPTYMKAAREDREKYKPVDSPSIRRLYLSELRKELDLASQNDTDLTPFLDAVQSAFKPIVEYLNNNILDNVNGEK